MNAPVSPGWHGMQVDAVLAELQASPDGLTDRQVLERRSRFGDNRLAQAATRPVWRILARQLASPLIYILLVAAVIAMALGKLEDALVILAVVLVNALVGAFQEGRAERSMAALRQLSTLSVRVLRNGTEQQTGASELVPGDLLLLAAGDAIGADARLLDQQQLQVAEATLTGESVPVSKSVAALAPATGLADRRNMVYSGTHVTAGRARALVVATGAATEIGQIARLTEHAVEPRTPMELRIAQFGRWLVTAALGLFVLVVLLGLWRQLPLAEVLMVAISQMVSMVPEGLPVAMTIALAVGMQRMAGRGAIVRRLSAVETLGSTTVICTDKTGTLTRNEMTVVTLWLPDGRQLDVSGIGYAPAGTLTQRGGMAAPADDPALYRLLDCAVLCNDAQLQAPGDAQPGWSVLGDPTEGALLVLAAKAGIDVAALREHRRRDSELPFDADHKLMATCHPQADGDWLVCLKGAPEALVRLAAPGQAQQLHAMRQAADAMAGDALRVLAFAQVAGMRLSPDDDFDTLAGRLVMLGLVGQIDPPREEVKLAVADCRGAGIRPVMVTGDHKLTGLAIARQLGIAGPDDRAVDGTELERMGEPELMQVIDRIAVFARVQPAQKMRIVQALQARGEVVAMTGDGVNDAPALARADVGVAMGISGTEVAKSAARIVITDDNFATIVAAVEQGRVVYGNIRKVILYLFATSIDEVVVLMLALLAGYPLPLAAVQILWINVVTEGTLTVNLVMDPPDGDELRRTPVPRDAPLMDGAMLGRVALMASVAVLVCFGWFAWRQQAGAPLDLVRTEVFTLLAVCQWFNVINCQSASRSSLKLGLLRNRWLLGGLALSLLLQAAVLYLPVMNQLFHTVPLPPASLAWLALLASSVLWVEELRKLLVRASAPPGQPPCRPSGRSAPN